MEILLVRHGKTRGNLEGRYVGRTDEPLLPEAGQACRESPWRTFHPQLVYASPLLRCRQTAELLFEQAQILPWPGLEETDFGEFEYKNYEELNGHPAYQAWIDSGGTLAFPGGESGIEFRSRCCAAFENCIRDALQRGLQQIALVVHGGTIMSVMERYAKPAEDFYHWQVKNIEGFLVQYVPEGEGFFLRMPQ